ncbi:exodeoxyribonuclease VII small subunit, partial [bacterium]|nr:exodeoxyribonuclease VII small subunit [bacterium]
NGDIALDDAIKSFTEAMNLAKDCDKDLKDAEKALTEIVSEDGTLKEFKGEVNE